MQDKIDSIAIVKIPIYLIRPFPVLRVITQIPSPLLRRFLHIWHGMPGSEVGVDMFGFGGGTRRSGPTEPPKLKSASKRCRRRSYKEREEFLLSG